MILISLKKEKKGKHVRRPWSENTFTVGCPVPKGPMYTLSMEAGRLTLELTWADASKLYSEPYGDKL